MTSQAYWTVAGGVNVNGVPSGSGFNAIIDSGTSIIVVRLLPKFVPLEDMC